MSWLSLLIRAEAARKCEENRNLWAGAKLLRPGEGGWGCWVAVGPIALSICLLPLLAL